MKKLLLFALLITPLILQNVKSQASTPEEALLDQIQKQEARIDARFKELTQNNESLMELKKQIEDIDWSSIYKNRNEKKAAIIEKYKNEFENLQNQWEQLQDKIASRGKEIIDQLNLKNSEFYKLIEDRETRYNKLWQATLRENRLEELESGVMIHPASPDYFDKQIKEWDQRIKELSKLADKTEEDLIKSTKAKDETLNNLKQEAEKIEKEELRPPDSGKIPELFKKISNEIDSDRTIQELEQQIKERSQKIKELREKKDAKEEELTKDDKTLKDLQNQLEDLNKQLSALWAKE